MEDSWRICLSTENPMKHVFFENWSGSPWPVKEPEVQGGIERDRVGPRRNWDGSGRMEDLSTPPTEEKPRKKTMSNRELNSHKVEYTAPKMNMEKTKKVQDLRKVCWRSKTRQNKKSA